MSNRFTVTAGLTAALLVIMVAPAIAQTPAPVVGSAPAARASGALGAVPSQRVDLLVGRSAVLKTERPIKRVSLPKPDIADALVTSPNEVLVHGKMPGTISLLVWGDTGEITSYDVTVRRDLGELEQRVRQLFPGEPIQVSSNGGDVVLSGIVSSKYIVDKATSLAGGYVEKADNVVNLLRQQEGMASNQILLRVRFAEVSRSAMQELGASFFTSPTGVKNTLGRLTTQQFAAPGYDNLRYTKDSADWGADVTSAAGEFTFSDFLNLFLFSEKYDIGTMIRALSGKGLFQSLAEPNLVTQNGKEASFLAGGEYPYPVVQGAGATAAVTIEFKEFGIRLKFTPTVIGSDLINLKVSPEVSALDFGNAVSLQGFRVPALTTRRTTTEVELRDGQTFAIAGLIDNSLTETMSKVPGIGDIPVIGYLFRSRAYQKKATELVVMITPQILRRDSTGVTPNLPNLQEPFLDPEKRQIQPPPPAFTRPGGSANVAMPQAPAMPAPVVVAPMAAVPPTQVVQTTQAPAPAPAPPVVRAAAPMPAATVQAAAAAPAVDRKAAEKARREEEKRLKDDAQKRAAEEEKRAKEEEKRAREAAAIEARRAAEEQKKLAEDQKRLAAEQKKLAEQQKKAAEQQKKAADQQKRREDEDQDQAQAQQQMEQQVQQAQARLDADAAQEAVDISTRTRKLEEQRAEAERRKIEDRRKSQQKAAKRRALSDPYPPLRSRRNW